MNHNKQVYKAVSAFVLAEQATDTNEAIKAIKRFTKASKKLAKEHN